MSGFDRDAIRPLWRQFLVKIVLLCSPSHSKPSRFWLRPDTES